MPPGNAGGQALHRGNTSAGKAVIHAMQAIVHSPRRMKGVADRAAPIRPRCQIRLEGWSQPTAGKACRLCPSGRGRSLAPAAALQSSGRGFPPKRDGPWGEGSWNGRGLPSRSGQGRGKNSKVERSGLRPEWARGDGAAEWPCELSQQHQARPLLRGESRSGQEPPRKRTKVVA